MRPETYDAVAAQEFDGEIEWRVGLHNPFPYETHQNVLAQYVEGRKQFLESDADAMLLFEHDMTMPADAVQKLYDTKADVVYGVYLLRHGSLVLNTWEYIGSRNLGESLSLMPRVLAAARKNNEYRVCGCGFGCTLIRREIVERFEFHKGDDDQWCPDIPFALDCIHNDVVCKARFDVICDHFDDGLRLTPFENKRYSDEVQVTANESLNVAIIRETMNLQAGKVYTIPRAVARDLERAGYVTVLVEPVTEDLEAVPVPERADMKALEKAVKHIRVKNGL